MNETVYTILRNGRATLQTVVEPLDRLALWLNNKHNYPPLRLRQAVGNLNDYEGSAAEYVAYLKLLCGLKPGDTLLDIGCGCGTILQDTTGAGGLIPYIGLNGRYVGLDLDSRAIKWCQQRYFTTCKFFAACAIPYGYYRFDAVLCKSLFTHLLEDDVHFYLQYVHSVLKLGGKCLATFFILDERPLQGKFTFQYRQGNTCVQRIGKPQLAVAYPQLALHALLDEVGFRYTTYYGTWRGDGQGLSFQDIIILEKKC